MPGNAKTGVIIYFDRMQRRIETLEPLQFQSYMYHYLHYAQTGDKTALKTGDNLIDALLAEDKVLIDQDTEKWHRRRESAAAARQRKKEKDEQARALLEQYNATENAED